MVSPSRKSDTPPVGEVHVRALAKFAIERWMLPLPRDYADYSGYRGQPGFKRAALHAGEDTGNSDTMLQDQYAALIQLSLHLIASSRYARDGTTQICRFVASGVFDRSEDEWGRGGSADFVLGPGATLACDHVLRRITVLCLSSPHSGQRPCEPESVTTPPSQTDLAVTVPEFPDNASYEAFLADVVRLLPRLLPSAAAVWSGDDTSESHTAASPLTYPTLLEDRTVLRHSRGRGSATESFVSTFLCHSKALLQLRGIVLRHITAADHQYTPALDRICDAVRQCVNLQRLEFGRGGLPWHAWCTLSQLHTLCGAHLYSTYYGGGSYVTFRMVADALPLLRHLEATYSEPEDLMPATLPQGDVVNRGGSLDDGGEDATALGRAPFFLCGVAVHPPPLDGFMDIALRLKFLAVTDMHHHTVLHAAGVAATTAKTAASPHHLSEQCHCLARPLLHPPAASATGSAAPVAFAVADSGDEQPALSVSPLETLVYRVDANTRVECGSCTDTPARMGAAPGTAVARVVGLSRLDAAMHSVLCRAPSLVNLSAPCWLVRAAFGAYVGAAKTNSGSLEVDASLRMRKAPPSPTWLHRRRLVMFHDDDDGSCCNVQRGQL